MFVTQHSTILQPVARGAFHLDSQKSSSGVSNLTCIDNTMAMEKVFFSLIMHPSLATDATMKKREKSWNPHTFYYDRSECHSRLVVFVVKQKKPFAFSCWLRKHLETLTSQGSLQFSYLVPRTGLCPSSTIAATSYLPFRASIRSRKSSRARMWTPGSRSGCSPAAWWRLCGQASKTSWKWVQRPLRV